MEVLSQISSSPGVQDFRKRFKRHYKEGNVWTLETGCLLFTSWMVYYLIFVSPDASSVLDIIVLIFFLLGVAVYFISSSFFERLSQIFSGQKKWIDYLKLANRYLFMVLSFLPGIYFAFKYEHFILRYYLVIYIVTSVYFLYKRYKEFEMEPFLIGLGMSVALYMIGPIIHTFFGIFGSSWFWTSLANGVESVVDLVIAVSFLLHLPQKYLPSNMLFGLKLIKYFMYFLSWQTWFTLMIFATWSNLGSAAQALVETWNNIEIDQITNPTVTASKSM